MLAYTCIDCGSVGKKDYIMMSSCLCLMSLCVGANWNDWNGVLLHLAALS